MNNYKAIFEALQATMARLNPSAYQQLDAFKTIPHYADGDYYWQLVVIIFNSGFKNSIYEQYQTRIRHYFGDYRQVLTYDEADIQQMLADSTMLQHAKKIRACVDNAQTMQALIETHGSFRNYLASFGDPAHIENILRLQEALVAKFSYIGPVTALHLLTDFRYPVIKPDRVIQRIFQRLGLIEDRRQEWTAVFEARKFATATGYPVRYIDICFVSFGQAKVDFGVCLEKNPKCELCDLQVYCHYFQTRP